MRLQFGYLGASALLLSGCGSTWDIEPGVIQSLSKDWYYLDLDQDGWGDPNTDPNEQSGPDIATRYTATNGRDCDDAEDLGATLTGQIGAICPNDLAGGSDVLGLVYAGKTEYVATYGDVSPTTQASLAANDCALWGSMLETEGIATTPGHLATPEPAVELDPLLTDEGSYNKLSSGFAAWIGIKWDRALPAWEARTAQPEGAWVWDDCVDVVNEDGITVCDEDPSDPNASDSASIEREFAWCRGTPPSPYDLFAFAVLNIDDTNQYNVMMRDLPSKRLALVLRPGATEWCLGLPTDALSPAYTVDTAHAMCERGAPNPTEYPTHPAVDVDEAP